MVNFEELSVPVEVVAEITMKKRIVVKTYDWKEDSDEDGKKMIVDKEEFSQEFSEQYLTPKEIFDELIALKKYLEKENIARALSVVDYLLTEAEGWTEDEPYVIKD